MLSCRQGHSCTRYMTVIRVVLEYRTSWWNRRTKSPAKTNGESLASDASTRSHTSELVNCLICQPDFSKAFFFRPTIWSYFRGSVEIREVARYLVLYWTFFNTMKSSMRTLSPSTRSRNRGHTIHWDAASSPTSTEFWRFTPTQSSASPK